MNYVAISSVVFSLVKKYAMLPAPKPRQRTLSVKSKNTSGEGSYGTYFKLQDGKGVKVLRRTERLTMQEAMTNTYTEDAKKEVEIQQKAHAILGDLVPQAFGVVPVEMDGKWYAGVVMEHVEGQTLDSYLKAKYAAPNQWDAQCDERRQTLQRLWDGMRKQGINKSDNHEGNVLVTTDGKYKVIDWGLGAEFDEPKAIHLGKVG